MNIGIAQFTRTLGVCLALFSGASFAQTPFPAAAKANEMARCTQSVVSQGARPEQAHAYCTCVVDGVEKEFGMRELDKMLTARPNPKGSYHDRRLYSVINSCSHLSRLPR